MNYPLIIDQLFNIKNDKEFEDIAMQIFRFQGTHNRVYQQYLELLNRPAESISTFNDIPFLPIEFFKTRQITVDPSKSDITFLSSNTGNSGQSRHEVLDLEVYRRSFREGFRRVYGDPSSYCILALLPSYSERQGSSLIYMVDELIRESGYGQSGYYLYNHAELKETIRNADRKVILFGVSYALLDFAESNPFDMKDTIIIETGGMKGQRKELLREELHNELKQAFNLTQIHSEYGMTELLSQAYSVKDQLFECPPWMKVRIRETNDPFSYVQDQRSGGVNVIDLANINSCSFIATQDIGKKTDASRFEILGRFDHSDVRGCNLLVN